MAMANIDTALFTSDHNINYCGDFVHITGMARIADIGGAATRELLDTWTWFQSGINTDGAHNPVTSKK